MPLPPAPRSPQPGQEKRKLVLLVLILSALAGLLYVFKGYALVDCARVEGWVKDRGFWGPLYFCGLYILATLGLLPGLLLSLVAGVAYGPLFGTVLVTVGATIGSSIVFILARYLLRTRVEGMMSRQKWFLAFRARVAQDGLGCIIFVRLVPLFPFGGINLASALLPVTLAEFFFGSLIGMLPGSFAYVYLGRSGCRVVEPLLRGAWAPGAIPREEIASFAGAIVLLILLSLLPLLGRGRLRTLRAAIIARWRR